MIFTDYDNFCKSIQEADPNRKEKISKFAKFIVDYLSSKGILKVTYENVVRTYVYTGEFTDNLVNRLNKISAMKPHDKELKGLAKYAEKQKNWQRKFFDISIGFDSFEVRTKPLQFQNNKIFQKGIDVQLAVDMVAHAYNDSYDVAILCSGDVDLLESIKLTKNLGKKVIVCSTWETSAKNIRKEADIYIDMRTFTPEELDKFTITSNK